VICTHTLGGRTPHERQKEKKQGPQIAGERSEIWSAIAFTNANVSAAFAFSHSAVESVHILLFFGGLVPIAHPVGRTDGRMTDGQRYGRTDGRRTVDGGRRTDGQAAASTALSTPQSPMLSTLDFRRGVRMPSMAFDFAFLQHFLSLLIPIRIPILSLILILVGIGFCLCLLYGPCGVTSDHA